MRKIKRLVSIILSKFMRSHEKDIEDANNIALKAQKTFEQAKAEAVKAEAKFDEVIENMKEEMLAVNDKFGDAIYKRKIQKDKLKFIHELSDNISDK